MDPFCSRDTGSYLEPARAGQAASWWGGLGLTLPPAPQPCQLAAAAPGPRPWIGPCRRLRGRIGPDSSPPRRFHPSGEIDVNFPTLGTCFSDLKENPPSQAYGCQKPAHQRGSRESREGMLEVVR